MRKILIVEDNEGVSKLLNAVLGIHELINASTLEGGLNKLKEKPDILITDWRLSPEDQPKVTSHEIINLALKENIPVILYTATSTKKDLDLQKLLEEHVEIIRLQKPAANDEIREAVRRGVER